MGGIELLKQYAFSIANGSRRYHFGGSHPLQGFDCSGFIVELLKGAGEINYNVDMNAQGIFKFYKHLLPERVMVELGSLAFYGQSWENISHIGFCLSPHLMLEFGGGDSTTTTDEEAIRRTAFGRMRPIRYRRDYLGCIKPFYYFLEGV